MDKKSGSNPAVFTRLLSRLSPRRVIKALRLLFTEGPKAALQKSLEANYIDRDFGALRRAADFGLFLSYRPEFEEKAAELISAFSLCGARLESSDEKSEKGVSFLLFPEGNESPRGVYIVINKRRAEDMDESYLLLLKSAYEVLDTVAENFFVWEKRGSLARLPYFLPDYDSDERDFYLSRFLLAQELTDFESFYEKNKNFAAPLGDRVCLSLKETPARFENFKSYGIGGFSFFPGLRHRYAFLGCALSYKFLIKFAKDSGFRQMLIAEDDTVFPPDFEERFKKISDFLRDTEFDVFSGLMAESESAEILGFFRHEGENIVLTDRLMSMVFNIYSENVYDSILDYDENFRDPFKNTVDRFLSGKTLRVFCALPFLAGHSENGGSTLWNRSSHYGEMISKSEKTLEKKLEEFLMSDKAKAVK